MPQLTLIFRIRQDGRVEETVQGVVGDECQHLTERLEDALGKLETRTSTAEYFVSSNQQTQSIPAQLH